jgi:hypothetical protein
MRFPFLRIAVAGFVKLVGHSIRRVERQAKKVLSHEVFFARAR